MWEVHPHVNVAPDDQHFNHVDLNLCERTVPSSGEPVIRRDVPVMQRLHGKFQGTPWTPRRGDMVIVAWLNDDEPLVIGEIPSQEQEPVCRSMADGEQQEIVNKLCPHEDPELCELTKRFIHFPDPKHPDCFKWWPKTRDSIYIFNCAEGHASAKCDAQTPCNCLDDHVSSTCFKNFSDSSPTAIDKPLRFKFLHHCGSYWYFDDDAVWRIAGKKSKELGFIHHYANGKVEINSPVEVLIKAPTITLDGNTHITENNLINGECTHGACSCDGVGGSGIGTGSQQQIEHGLVDIEDNPVVPSEVSCFCTGSGGTCTVDYCDDVYIYITCTSGVTYKWKVRAR